MQSVRHQIEKELSGFYPQGELKVLVRMLLQQVAGWSLVDMLTHNDLTLTAAQQMLIADAVNRLKRYEPIQYILGAAEFDGMRLVVDARALIPRPETEELVLLLAETLSPDASVLDIGTGSGCIAVALAHRLPQAQVSAYDVSPDALALAAENARNQGVKIDFRQVDILHDAPADAPVFDAIVSNPPYVTDSERASMEANVLDYEPALALFVPDDDPLLFYRAIADFAWTHLSIGGRLFFEINHRFGAEIVMMLRHKGFANCAVQHDAFGKERFVVAQK
ncbi:MAG: peptide chain release factor N(5)-glutamine methyltransferase [Bacteroidales bacterium]|nr:peptide chain release factor N(5)-glutamine methyltransferase [Bacteroidales bacterium]